MKFNLTLFREDLLPVYTTDLNNKVVNGRELHKFLGIGKVYAAWVRDVIKKHGLQPKDHYATVASVDISVTGVISKSGKKAKKGRPTIEYIFLLDPAKKIAMGTNNAQGDRVKDYFIMCEKVAFIKRVPMPELSAHSKREIQIQNSKDVAAFNFHVGGVETITKYYQEAMKMVTGHTPSEIKKMAKEAGLPSKYYNNARECVRGANPADACALSLTDTLVMRGAELNQLQGVIEDSKSLFDKLITLGFTPKELAA